VLNKFYSLFCTALILILCSHTFSRCIFREHPFSCHQCFTAFFRWYSKHSTNALFYSRHLQVRGRGPTCAAYGMAADTRTR